MFSGFKEGVRILPFKTVVKMGEESKLEENHPSADDTAIIMYTSGSTGVPKVCTVYTSGSTGVPKVCTVYTRGSTGAPKVCTLYSVH